MKAASRGRCLFCFEANGFIESSFQKPLAAEGVSDAGADAGHEVGVEASGHVIGVAVDVVDIRLGTDKDIAPKIIAETTGEMLHEVIGAGVVDAAALGKMSAGRYRGQIEAGVGGADAGHEVESEFLIQLGLEDHVDVGQDRPIGFVAIVAGLVIAPGGFEVQA